MGIGANQGVIPVEGDLHMAMGLDVLQPCAGSYPRPEESVEAGEKGFGIAICVSVDRPPVFYPAVTGVGLSLVRYPSCTTWRQSFPAALHG